MKKLITFIALALCLVGCGTSQFVPQEYPLRAGLIPSLNVNGIVVINNDQNSKDPAIVYSYMGTKLATNYNKVTEVMVVQAAKELKNNAIVKNSPIKKSINIKVNYLLSTYGIMYWKSELKYTAALGNGKTINKVVTHGSGVLIQDLDGCISESVIDLFKDETVKAYLAE